jgi:hypothetical protein
MLVFLPILIDPQSPRKVAPNHTFEFSPIVTSPIMMAVGAIYADSWI